MSDMSPYTSIYFLFSRCDRSVRRKLCCFRKTRDTPSSTFVQSSNSIRYILVLFLPLPYLSIVSPPMVSLCMSTDWQATVGLHLTFLVFPSEQAHPAGAINIQIYRLIKEWTAWDIARRAAFAFFGIFQGTEENPEFIKGMTVFPPSSEWNRLASKKSTRWLEMGTLRKEVADQMSSVWSL